MSMSTGCYLGDPNHNPKVRYAMATRHAREALKDAGYDLTPGYPDYDLMIFGRRHYDRETEVLHHLVLYDFLKIADKPGPNRFVIAYDTATRETYLRPDLRSNENLERLAPAANASDPAD